MTSRNFQKAVVVLLLYFAIAQPISAKYSGSADLIGDEWVDLEDLALLCDNWLKE